MSLTQQTGRNARFNLLAFAYSAAAAFVVIPIVVRHLGAERYGILTLTGTVLGFVSILNLGFGTSLLKFLAEEFASRSRDEAERLFGASLLLNGVIGLIGLLVSTVIGLWFTTAIFNLSSQSVPQARFAFVVAGVGFMIVMLAKPFTIVLLSTQRYDLQAKVSICLATLSATGTILVLYMGYGLRALLVFFLAIDLLALLVYVFLARRLVGDMAMRPRWHGATFRRMFSFSSFVFIANIGSLFLAEFDRVMIGVLASVTLVAFYAVPIGLASRIYSAVVSLAGVAIPLSSDLFARSDLERVRLLYAHASRFVTLFMLSLSIPTLVFGEKVLRYWIGPEYAERSDVVLRILVVSYMFMALGVVAYNIAVGSGRPQIAATFNGVMALLNVVLVLVLVPRFGITGAAIAYLASTIPLLGFLHVVERRVLHLSVSPWPSTARRLAIPTAIQVGVSFALLPLASNLTTLVVMLALSSPVLLISYIALVADSEERSLLRNLLTGATPRAR